MAFNLVTIILAITVIVSLIALQDRSVLYKLTMNPYSIKHQKQYYRFLTSGFIHNDFMHLAFNMFVFFSFGRAVLDNYMATFDDKGAFYFLLLYLGGVIFSDMPSYVKYHNSPSYNSLGASGAVSGVLFASILFNPLDKLFIFPIPIPLPGVIFGVIYLIGSYYMSKRGGDNINHDAHLFGALFGMLFTITLKPSIFMSFIHQISSLFN